MHRATWEANRTEAQQVGCNVVGVATPAGRFTGLVCSLGLTLWFTRSLKAWN